jgi:hypothetical protein
MRRRRGGIRNNGILTMGVAETGEGASAIAVTALLGGVAVVALVAVIVTSS